jgi:hypothetical protein
MPAARSATEPLGRKRVGRPAGETSRRSVTTKAVQASVVLERSAETSPRARTATAHNGATAPARTASATTPAARPARAGAASRGRAPRARARKVAPPGRPAVTSGTTPPPRADLAETAPKAAAPSARAPIAAAVVGSGVVRVRVLVPVLRVRVVGSGVVRVRVLVPVLRVRVVGSGVVRVPTQAPVLPVGRGAVLRAAKAAVLSVRARRPEVGLSDATTLAVDVGTAAGRLRVANAGRAAGHLRVADAGSLIAVAGSPVSVMAVVRPTAVASRSNAAAGLTRSPGRGETPARPSPRT